jgi:predicted nucleic acid-binding protein
VSSPKCATTARARDGSADRVVLVDTSIWIEVFRRNRPLDLAAIVHIDDVVTCLPIVQEVLQGFRDDHAYRKAHTAMWSLALIESPMDASLFDEAVDLYRLARKRGLTIRSTVDCLIAAAALRHGLEVLHRDRDFAELAKISHLRERQP